MGLDAQLATTLPGLVARIAQRLLDLDLTLCIPINTLLGRAARASPPTTEHKATSSF